MNPRYLRQFIALLSCTLVFSLLQAQPVQRLHSYDTAPRTGVYNDVVTLPATAILSGKVVALGTTGAFPYRALVSICQLDGTPIHFREITSNFSDSLFAEGICKTANNQVIAAVWDEVNTCTHVYRIRPNGTLAWKKRLKDFHAKDVTSGILPGGNEAFFLTGFSTANNWVAIEALAGTGAGLFATEYDLNGPFRSTIGNEIMFDNTSAQVTVVGTADVDSCSRHDMIMMRTDQNGNFVWGRSYYDAGPLPYAHYFGKALVEGVLNPQNTTAAFEIADNGYKYPGLLNANVTGVRNWAWYYLDNGGGFFRGNYFSVGGLDTDGTEYMISGGFESFSNPAGQSSGYTLKADNAGLGQEWLEYENTGYYPANGTEFKDLEYNANNGHYYIGGEFNTPATAGGWPQGANSESFWLVAVDTLGVSACNTYDVPWTFQLGPAEQVLGTQTLNLPGPLFSGTNIRKVSPNDTNQCAVNKRGLQQDPTVPGLVTVAYLGDQQTIQVTLPGEWEQGGTAKIVDLQGRVLIESSLTLGKNQLDVSQLVTGMYLVQYEVQGVEQGVKKIFKW